MSRSSNDVSNGRPSRQRQRGVALPLKEDRLFELFSGEKLITPELTTYAAPGHTLGQTSIIVSSAGKRAIIAGDLAHHPAQVDRTDWRPGVDGDLATAVESRSKALTS